MSGGDGVSIETLQREADKLRKINAALMSRVERSIDQQYNAYSLFETAIALDHQVLDRTQRLHAAMREVERSNDTLLRAKQQAEAASSLKSSVLISVTHDLLQPLNAARLTLSTLAEVNATEQSAVLIEQVDRSLVTLDDLLRTLLDISKLDAGVLKPEVRSVSLEWLLAPLRQEFAPVAAKRGLDLTIRHAPQTILSDPLMLRRILQNLIGNALRYTRTGRVLLGVRRRGAALAIEVHDTGPGIPQTQRQAIFDEFQRGESSAGDGAGFGLGLSIVRRFATALGHEVRLASRIGHGSSFSVTVPRVADVIDRGAASVQINGAGIPFSGLEGARILLIASNSQDMHAMVTVLERWGCDVVTAASLTEAFERIGSLGRAPDVIAADLHLAGGESGVDAVDQLRLNLAIDIPALLVIEDLSPQSQHDAAISGLEALRKPVKPAELRSLLSFLLG